MQSGKIRTLAFAGALFVIATTIQVEAEPNGVQLMPVDTLTQYTSLVRGDLREEMLTTLETLATLKAGEPLPAGAQLVMKQIEGGILARYLVSQKTGDGPTDWEYQVFDAAGVVEPNAPSDQCYACHRSRESTQFMFTHSAATGFDG